MATEDGRASSSAKKLVIPERNALDDATIETTECLRGLVGLCPNQTRLGGGAQRRRGLQQHLDTIGQSPSTRLYIYVLYTCFLIRKLLTPRPPKQGPGTPQPVLYSLLGALQGCGRTK